MDDEQQEELKRDYDMKFTGKAIAVMSKQKIAFEIDQKLSLFNTQNSKCNCLLQCCCCCSYLANKLTGRQFMDNVLFATRADEPTDIYYQNLNISWAEGFVRTVKSMFMTIIVLAMTAGIIVLIKLDPKNGSSILAQLTAAAIGGLNKLVTKSIK